MFLSPVAALHSPAAALLLPPGSYPAGASVWRTHPAAVHPPPVIAAPVPVPIGPDVTRTRSIADRSIARRWRTVADATIVASSAGTSCHHRTSQHECGYQKLLSHHL